MPSTADSFLRIEPSELVRRLIRLARKGDDEPYTYPPMRARRVSELVDQAASGADGIACVGAVLKLVAVYRSKYGAPRAAQVLVDALRSSPKARRIVAKHWSSARRSRIGADLLPVRSGRAPNINDPQPTAALTARALLGANHDLRSAHLRARHAGRRT